MAWSGGGGQQQTGSQTQYNAISAFAAPYVSKMLGQGDTLTSQAYQPYQGAQNADFTNLQNQSFTGAGNLGVSGQTGQATNAANQATNNLLGTSYNGMQAQNQNFTDPGVASSYMNPYVQNALNPQIALLQQQQGAQGQQLQSQATQAGAFGGSRFGLQQGLQNQANQLAQSNLVGNAYNQAYTGAQNQFNADQSRNMQAQGMNIGQQQFGANLGLNANQAALTGANTLGNLGQQQFNQQTGALNLQNSYGTQQQQNQQNAINTQIQNFNNQKNYPYQQLSFMQGLMTGLPVSSSTTNVYQTPGNQIAQAAGLGLGAYNALGGSGTKSSANGGLLSAFKYGGEVQHYADGAAVSDPMSLNNIRQMFASMTPQELQEERKSLLGRTDDQGRQELAIVNELLGIQPDNPQQGESVPQAIPQGSIANAMTPDMADQMVQTAAHGGIMGYANGEEVKYKPTPEKSTSSFDSLIDSVKDIFVPSSEQEARGKMESSAQRPGAFERMTPSERARKQAMYESLTNPTYSGRVVTDPAEKAKLDAKLAAFKGGESSVNTTANPFAESSNPMDVSMSNIPFGNRTPEEHKTISEAANHIAATTGHDATSLLDSTSQFYDMLKDKHASSIAALDKFVENAKPKDTSERDQRDAVAKYGFNWAAKAAKPGATFLGSAAEAAPSYSEAIEKSRETEQARKDVYDKLQMSQMQYKIALDKGDMQSATVLAGQQRQLEMQAKQLNMTANHYAQVLDMEKEKLGQDTPEIRTLQAIKDRPELKAGIPDYAKLHGGLNLDARLAQSVTNLRNSKLDALDAKWAESGISTLDPNSVPYKNAYRQYMIARQSIMNNDQSGISSALPNQGIDLSQWGQPKVAGAK
jgi:hypothetical protein